MSYQFRITDEAVADLARLDRSVAQRILARIRWFADNFESVRHESLSGDLAGTFKLRVGDYRVLYTVDHGPRETVIRAIQHRSEVYRDRG